MSKYKVKYYNHISDSDYTLEQAKERVNFLNETFKGCNAHMIEVEDKKCIKLNCPNCSQEFEINITSDKELEELKPVLCYLCNKYSRN